MKYIICDLDGTLFNVEHRLHLLKNCRTEADYDRFHAAHTADEVNPGILEMLKIIQQPFQHPHVGNDLEIIFITGRHKKFEASTFAQLRALDLYCEHSLFMKESYAQFTPDFVKETLDFLFTERNISKEDILFVLDDRPATVKIYRDAGLLCLQVQDSTGFIEDIKK